WNPPSLECSSNAAARNALHSGCAILTEVSGELSSYRDGRRNMRVRLIGFEYEILRFVVENRLPPVLEDQPGQRTRQARQLQMVRIKMHVPAGPDENARLMPGFARKHVS